MNKDRRAQIARAITLLEEAKDLLETCQAEEEEAFDNLPDGLKEADRGEAMAAANEKLVEAVSGIEQVIEDAGEAAQ